MRPAFGRYQGPRDARLPRFRRRREGVGGRLSGSLLLAVLGTFLVGASRQCQAGIRGFAGFAPINASRLGPGWRHDKTILVLTNGKPNEATSVFFPTRQYVRAFRAKFIYQAKTAPGGGGDGMAFVLQTDPRGVKALGAAGSALGYGGSNTVAINGSSAVEINIYSGTGQGVGLLGENGATGAYTPTAPVNLASGHPIRIKIAFNGVLLRVVLKDMVSGRTFRMAAPFSPLAARAWIGFTGGSGAATAVQTVSNFSFVAAHPLGRGHLPLGQLYKMLNLRVPARPFGSHPRPVDYVSPFVGTAAGGELFPGAVVPFGMVQLSPDTRPQSMGYYYRDPAIQGFSMVHMSGVGMNDGGDVFFMPSTGQIQTRVAKYESPYRHANETASPGYYQVWLEKPAVNVQLTATAHCGMARLTFPAGKRANLLVPISHTLTTTYGARLRILGRRKIDGEVTSRCLGSGSPTFRVYFVMQLSQPFRSYGIWTGHRVARDQRLAEQSTRRAPPIGAFVSWPAGPERRVITMRIGLSYVDLAGAKNNLAVEMGGQRFSAIRRSASRAWNRVLSRITITGGTPWRRMKFYTALYHTMLMPSIFSDADGRYLGFDEKIHRLARDHVQYANYSGWDIYRDEAPLLALLQPRRMAQMCQSLVRDARQGGWMPRWPEANHYTNIMCGSPLTSFIATAWEYGLHHFNLRAAYRAMRKDATQAPPAGKPYSGESGITLMNKLHYLPADQGIGGSVSKTLEDCYAYSALARVARALGKSSDVARFKRRAMFWKNLFDPQTGFLRPRLINGTWLAPFNPAAVPFVPASHFYVEGSGWEYLFYVPQNQAGLIRLVGPRRFNRRLDHFFRYINLLWSGPYYNAYNEPDLEVPFLYDYSGEPWKTQVLVRRLIRNLYSATPTGIPGNDDCGAMSSWLVFAMMGFYPVDPARPAFELCAPVFPKVTIHLSPPYPGHDFTIVARRASRKNAYIRSVRINGRPWRRCWFSQKVAARGGTLSIALRSRPDKTWAAAVADRPPSMAVPRHSNTMNQAVSAAQGVLYHDDFDRHGDLDGSGAAPTDAKHARWRAPPGEFVTSPNHGGELIVSASPGAGVPTNGSAYLPVELRADRTYTLSATLCPDQSRNWLALGFGGQSTGNANNAKSQVWLLYASNSLQTFVGGGTNHGQGYTPPTGDKPDAVTITINTEDRRVRFSDRLGIIAPARIGDLTPAELKAISAIFIGQNTGGGSFRNVVLKWRRNPPRHAARGHVFLEPRGAWISARSRPTAFRVAPPTPDPTYELARPALAAAGRYMPPPSWIWADEVRDNQSVYLRREFRLARALPHCRLYIAADNRFKLFVNGRFTAATDGGESPHWAHPRKLKISGYLHPGLNVIAVQARNLSGPAGVIVWMLAGGKTILVSDGKWRASEQPSQSASWRTNSFNDSAWKHAVVQAKYGQGPWGWRLHPWPITGTPYLAHLQLVPVRINIIHGRRAFEGVQTLLKSGDCRLRVRPARAGHAPPEMLLDFGREVAGRMQVRGQGGTLLMHTGETPGEALNPWAEAGDGPWANVQRVGLSAGAVESTPDAGFRYVAIKFPGSGPISLDRLRLDFIYYPVVYRGAFSCSDPLLTKIWYTGAYTVHLCMQQDIWDAPKRDRGMWMGDLQVEGDVINNVFLDRFLMVRTLTALRADAQGGRAASAMPVNYVNGIVGYSNAWICALWDFYLHTGDRSYIRGQLPLLLSMLRYMRRGFNHKGVFTNKWNHWCFCDWAPHLGDNSGDTPQERVATDLYTCLAVHRAIGLLRVLGDHAEAARYRHWRQRIVAAARRYLAAPETHIFTNIRQVNAMAIYSGVADRQERRAIFRRILAPGRASWKQVATPYYNYFVLWALAKLGHYHQALHFIRGYWGGMIREGATTFWEGYDPSWPKKYFHRYLQADNRPGYFVSLCHGWSAGVTAWLTENVLGVRPIAGGFKEVSISPHLGGLSWADGRVPTPRGVISIHIRKLATGEIVRLTLPKEVHATIAVPGASARLNGRLVKMQGWGANSGIIKLNQSGAFTIETYYRSHSVSLHP